MFAVLLLGCIAGGAYFINQKTDGGNSGGKIIPISPTLITVSGTVTQNGKPVADAELTIDCGNDSLTATTDTEGKYLINNVKNGIYNLVCVNGESVLTKIAVIQGESVVVDYDFPSDDESTVKAIVKTEGDSTPSIAVDGLSTEAILNMITGREVDTTLVTTLLSGDEIPADDKTSIEKISGELENTYYDFTVLKEVIEDKKVVSSEYITKTQTVLCVVVPFDSSRSVATYVFRSCDGEAVKMKELEKKPDGDYTDGTYYVSSDYVFIYADTFSTYVIGAANGNEVVRGSDTVTYSDQVTVNLKTRQIDLLYQHDADSTNDAVVEIYLMGTEDNVLIAKSETVPAGYKLTGLELDKDTDMPSVGTYSGLMKIIYLGGSGADTNVNIPLTVTITQ